ncbi:MAG TPA: TetR/AcrR family transcriptional regulator [Acidimicrobiales bacterium]|nr:TetR/AcrR family transcriptional regulator [Acidimicrobiales bacterium]
MPKVSEEHKRAVRRRILEAARSCLERNGYQEVTTRELVAEAGVSTGTFYNYFPSKEHLYAGLAEDALGADLAVALGDAGPGQGVGPGLLRFLRESLLADPSWATTVASLRARAGRTEAGADAVARLNHVVTSTFSPLVAAAGEDGFLRADLDAEALVELIDIVWDGMGRRAAGGAFQSSYGRVARVLVQVLLDGAVSPARRSEVPNA